MEGCTPALKKRSVLLTFCLFLLVFVGSSQQQQRVSLFSALDRKDEQLSRKVPNHTLLKPSKEALAQIQRIRPDQLEFDVPIEGKTVTLTLRRSALFSEGSIFTEGRSTGEVEVAYQPLLHYQGSIKGLANSTVAVTIGDGQIAGVISDEKSNLNLSPVDARKNRDSVHVVYRAQNEEEQKNWSCGVVEIDSAKRNILKNLPLQSTKTSGTATVGCPVDIYFEADYSMYQHWGSTTATINYIASFFNVVQKLYENENIRINIKQIKVWTVSDPYASASNTTTSLNLFSSAMTSGFNGDLAHLVSQRSLGGGRAYIDVLCSTPTYKTGVSQVYSYFNQFPNYSWTAYVIAHELGHNFGSPHTQSCSWPGGALDNCYTTEGGCISGPAPVGGGTIMSYCHLISTGINFNNGFGTLPGNLLRTRTTNANCVCNCNKLEVDVTTVNAACNIMGSATAEAKGGTPPYTYQWSDGQTTKTATNLSAGNYHVVVKDKAANCQVLEGFTISGVGISKATITPSGSVVECGTSEELTAVEGGIGFSYQWFKNGAEIDGATNKTYKVTETGSYKVQITSGGCKVMSAATEVKIVGMTAPVVSASGPVTFCQGGAVTFSYTATPGYSYQWYKAVGQPVSGASGTSYSANVSGNYFVIASSQGCSLSSNAFVVNVVSNPSASITASSATTFCDGDSVRLSAPFTSGYTYQWYKDDAVISSATTNLYTAKAAGKYKLVTKLNNCTATSNSIDVVVNPSPEAQITADGSTTLCEGSSINLKASAGAGYSYAWFKNGQPVTGVNVDIMKVSASGNYTVRTSAKGCTRTSLPIQVVVHKYPGASLTADGVTTFCEGGSVLLKAAPQNNYTFQWKRDGVVLPAASQATYNAAATGTYTVNISNEGCVSTSNSITVNAKPNPSLSVTASGNTSICAGTQLVLTSASGTGYQHQWYKDGSAISGASQDKLTIVSSGTYLVRNTLNGCSGNSAATVVTVLPNPTITVQPNVVTHIKSRNLTITASGAQQYNFAQQPYLVSSGVSSMVVNPPQSVNYQVVGTASNGCTASANVAVTVIGCGDVKEMKARVYSPSRAHLSWINPEGVNSDTLEYKAEGSQQWNKVFVNGSEHTLTGLQPNTSYMFRVTSLCATSNKYFYADTAYFTTQVLEQEVYLNVMPNPVSTTNHLEVISQQQGTIQADIYTLHGQFVTSILPVRQFNGGHIYHPFSLSAALAPGTYMVVVTINGKKYVTKLVKV